MMNNRRKYKNKVINKKKKAMVRVIVDGYGRITKESWHSQSSQETGIYKSIDRGKPFNSNSGTF